MRKALNENPVVQVVLLGVLGLIVALVFMMGSGGGAEPAPEPGAEASTTGVPAADAAATGAVSGLPGAAAPALPADGAAPVATPPPVVSSVGFESSDGLPKELVNAYEDGDVVVLLVQQDKGIEDKKLRKEVESLGSRGDTSVFVVDSKRVADYSRIAEGVNLDRIPAIVVIHPKSKGAENGALPVASVSYGYRGQASVEQAVRDALYDGKQLPYHP